MTNISDRIRRKLGPLLEVVTPIMDGLAIHEETVKVKQNTLALFAAEFTALRGSEAGPGSEATYNMAAAQWAQTRTAMEGAALAGRKLARTAKNVLKSRLGEQMNAAWQSAGFVNSLAIPTDSYALLTSLETYFRAHPETEVAPLEVTAAKIHEVLIQLDTARRAKIEASSKAKAAMQRRDADREALYKRVLAFRNELKYLLPADDARWQAFGLPRPIDLRIPASPGQPVLRQIGAGAVELTWLHATRATRYRVFLQTPSDTEPRALDSVRDEQAILRDLPVGVKLSFTITAANKSGESQPSPAGDVTLS